MTETTNRYKTYKPKHSIYGGEIDIEDFNTYSPNKKRINNQAAALDLQRTLEKELTMKEYYKNFTQEELREMRLISNSDGRPSSTLTDEKWQKEFNLRKMFITPYVKEIKKLGGKFSRETGMWNEETMGKYLGQTNWQEYCSYINDVLNNIRSGQTDYCYFIYQIIDLLKFHYNNLRTRYCDGYWEVWLEK